MTNGRDFRDLIVWQKAMQLTKTVYQQTRAFPESERFGLTSQMRRSAVSVPSNIAEGNARDTIRDYVRHLIIARGSLAELETQIILATDLSLLPETPSLLESLQDVKRLLQALIQSLRQRKER